MSKTFENVHTEYGGSMIVREEGDCVSVSINMVNPSDTSIHIAPSDAPALALAILEAANHDMGSEVSLAVEYLERYTEAVAEKEAEAKEQAKLEAEALELCDSARHAHGRFKIGNFGLMKDAEKTTWLAVARRAREMRAEK